jgi:hypothetical protein
MPTDWEMSHNTVQRRFKFAQDCCSILKRIYAGAHANWNYELLFCDDSMRIQCWEHHNSLSLMQKWVLRFKVDATLWCIFKFLKYLSKGSCSSTNLCAWTWISFNIMYPCAYRYISKRYTVSHHLKGLGFNSFKHFFKSSRSQ